MHGSRSVISGPLTYQDQESEKDKFQITRFLRFASQITRPTIFSCLARFPSNQFTQSPTIHVSAYPVANISHVRLPGRPNFSSRSPGNDIFLLSSNFIKKLTNQFTQSPTIRVSAYPVANHFSCQITRSAKFLVQITRRLTYFSLQLTRADTDGCLARRKGRTQREPRRAQPIASVHLVQTESEHLRHVVLRRAPTRNPRPRLLE